MTSAGARSALWVSILACALGCAEPVEDDAPAEGRTTESIVHRLVDPTHRLEAQVAPETLLLGTGLGVPARPGGLAGVASATIEDDTRYVLASHPNARLRDHQLRLDASGSEWAVSVALGSELRGAAKIVAVPLVKIPGRKWQTLDAVLLPVYRSDRGRLVDLDLPATIPRSGKVRLQVEAHQPPGRTTSYRTRAIDIPGTAALEFSLGVLEAARNQGPVRFFIEACHEANCAAIFDEVLEPASEAAQGWQDRRVDLSPLGGSPTTLHFTTVHMGDGAFSLPVWGAPTVVAATAEPDTRLNVVLLSIDTLRRDHLDLYGYDRETAPYLRNRLAARGTAIESLIAEAASTDPSHMTMFTSLPSLVHGVTCCRKRLAVPVVTLAEILRGRGYHTAAFTENGPLAHERGFSIGFDRYIENKTPGRIRPTGHVARTFGQARSWLEEHSEGPFFLFLHTFQVHAPYEPPAAYERTFADSPSRGASAEAGPIIDAYDREIRYTDDELRMLHEWMEARGINERTLWIVLSDHGEEFFEHGTRGHATLPYETVLRVPMIFQGPGIRSGARLSSAVRHVDLMPTVLDLLGMPAEPQSTGASFAAALLGNAAPPREDLPPTPIFSTSWVLPKGMTAPALSVRQGDFKLIRYQKDGAEHFEFYDLASDPDEANDLYSADDTRQLRLREHLVRYLKESSVRRRALAGAGSESHESPLFTPDPDTEETLRALGYIE
ncbi:MAG: sulfatase [Deltaproteobacteria bacterium]|nr:sulfatase [Deltaproteobacteria bacterium]MBW2401395.1 sulfatase [Deltaproteobacteria bacterium]